MLIGIEGNVGSGKTVYGVRCLKLDSDNGRKIVSNTPLIDIPFTTFNIDEFLDNKYNELLKNATVFIDEITVYMDCRLGSSKQNLLMGYLVLQSRKRGIDIYYTTQDLDLVDYKRLVKYTNIIVYAQEIFVKNLEGRTETVDDYRNYTIIDMRRKKDNITQFNMKITPYYKYYDTDYIITPLVKMNVKKTA
jgi:hypothetical protein